jgi:hypothetical protein
MKTFLQRFGAFVLGVLCGFDRIRFRGSRRQLCYPGGMESYLGCAGVVLKDYKLHAEAKTVSLCQAIEARAKKAGLYAYVNSSEISKEETALAMAARNGITQGPIAVLSCVEPCRVVQVRGNKETGRLEPQLESGKCLHYYHYDLDPVYGLRYTRLQSWFPFTMHVGINGRDWLAQQMTRAGIRFTKKDNCFTWVEDFAAAQKLLDEQLTTAWPELLERWTQGNHPWLASLLKCDIPYYWSVQEGEYATDIAFRSAGDLARLYPLWVHHAYATLQSGDLLRFMNYRVRADGKPHGEMRGEVKTTIKELLQGTCVRQRILNNLLKMYDKMSSVLRLESLLIDVRHFKVFRTTEGDEAGPMSYLRLRKGVADMQRRAEVSRAINDRYAHSLATVEEKQTLAELTEDLGQRRQWKGRSVRALNPLSPEDVPLLEAISQGKFMISGFRNSDLREILMLPVEDPKEQNRQAAKVTRLLRLLRAHGLIAKVSTTNRYQLTDKGRASTSVLLAARQANTRQLLKAA